MQSTSKTLQIVFFIFAVGFLICLPFTPFPGDFIIKAIPALSLAVLCWMSLGGSLKYLMTAALVFSAGGDIALSFYEGPVKKYFILGLALFLIAHVIYITAFAKDLKFQKSRMPFVLLLMAFSGLMFGILGPRLGEMLLPVGVYILVITGMGVVAIFNTRGGNRLLIGAGLFLLSDSVIAVNRFLFDEPQMLAPFVVMVTYYAAQYLIATSYIFTENKA